MKPSSVSFADDWPVQAEDPLEMALDQPFLPPHEALKVCSGSDVHLVKGASNPSNRCLAILPGLLALHPPKAPEVNTQNNSSNDNPDTSEKDNDAKTAATKAEPVPLGEMHGLLSTDTPTLRLGCLQLQGQRVRTSSKFLVLTIQPKKKRVICKHIFDSVVLFGQAQVNETTAAASPSESEHPWVHYGGSARAGTNGANVSCLEPTRASTKEAVKKPFVEPAKPNITKDFEKKQQNEESNDDSESIHSVLDDTKDEDEFHMDIAPSSLGRRASSQRKVKAPVKYVDEEPDTDSSDNESDGEKPIKRALHNKAAGKNVALPKPKSQPSSTVPVRGKPKSPPDTLSSDSEDDCIPLKRAGRPKKTVPDKEDQSDDESDVVVVQPSSRPSSTRAPAQTQKPPPTTKSAKRVAPAKKTAEESLDEEEVVEVLPSSQPAPTRTARGRQKSPPVSLSQEEEKVVVVGTSTRKRNSPPVTQSQDGVGDAEAGDSDPSEANHSDSDDDFEAPQQKPRATAANKSKRVSSEKTPQSKRQRVSAAATDSLASTVLSPASRRRRTGGTPSPSKKPVATKFFQASNDFSFT